MLSLIILSLIWFFLVVGILSLLAAVGIFFMSTKEAAALFFGQICGICFVIVLVASIAAKGVGL